MKTIPTWPQAGVHRFLQMAFQDYSGEVGEDKMHFIG